MVNLDSDLAREHPDWLLQTEHGPGVASRSQHVWTWRIPPRGRTCWNGSALVEEYGVR